MTIDPSEISQLSDQFEGAPAEDVLAWAWERLGPRVALGTAFGSTGMVLMDLMQKTVPQMPIFTLDTGYLFQETLELKARAEARYGVRIESVHPDQTVDEQDREYGPRLFQRDPDRCCFLRKVAPLQRKLAVLDGWVTSLRRDQGKTRELTRVLEPYRVGDGRVVVKINPMVRWTRKQVWDYILEHGVPYNPLMDQGYPSVGCWPCTRQVGANADERAGRWAGTGKTECGIHTFLTEHTQEACAAD